MPLVIKWQNRPLEEVYCIVYMDVIHFKVKQEGSIVNKAAYMAIGINLEGKKDVLGIWIGGPNISCRVFASLVCFKKSVAKVMESDIR